MKTRLYAIDRAALNTLLDARRSLLAEARELGSAEKMREGITLIYESAQVYRAPRTAEEAAKTYTVDAEGAAHIPIVGSLTPQADPCAAFAMGSETEYGFVLAALAAAEADPAVSSIALDINSPGGYVDGVDQVAQAIAAVSKSTTAYVGDMAASAAYWLASQADRIVALSPASRVGSIGVAAEEYDDRAALEAEGVAHRVYTSTDAPDKRPDTATDEGRAKVVAGLDDLHSVFVRRVAEGRHVTADKVKKDFGRGGVLIAEKALAAGMIDEVIGAHLSRTSPAGVASSAAATSAAISTSKESPMDVTQLKAEHPDLVAQISAEAEKNGIDKERTRREKLLGLGVNAEASKAVAAAIASGESFEEASAKIVTAALRGTGGENPPAIVGSIPDTGSGASTMSAEDRAWYVKHGVSEDELKKLAASAAEGKE